MSACHSFEAWKDRKPFIYEGKRIYVGRKFMWKGKEVKCTSFAKDGGHLIACYFRYFPKCENPTFSSDVERKVDRRFKIKYEDLRKGKKAD